MDACGVGGHEGVGGPRWRMVLASDSVIIICNCVREVPSKLFVKRLIVETSLLGRECDCCRSRGINMEETYVGLK